MQTLVYAKYLQKGFVQNSSISSKVKLLDRYAVNRNNINKNPFLVTSLKNSNLKHFSKYID